MTRAGGNKAGASIGLALLVALSAERKSQVGTGDRAEKIRTYNYPQRRITDHRINFSVHNLDQVLSGEPDELTSALQDAEKRSRLEAQAGGA